MSIYRCLLSQGVLMCGLVGGLGKNINSRSHNFSKSIKSIVHRGPDFSDYYHSLEANFFSGHVRLSILDLSSNAHQPFRDNSSVMAYNGEIYNHLKLREDLLLKNSNISFKGNSDTETLFHGLNLVGQNFLNHCSGMFAGSFFDKKSNSLTLFRDTLGIKPLYYTIIDETLYYCSEIKGIYALSDASFRVDKNVLNCYFLFENFPQDQTLTVGIKQLNPGEILRATYENQKLKISSTFIKNQLKESDLSPKRDMDRGELIGEGRRIIERAIESHLLSDVNLGVYLSGGIDSNLVAAIAAQNSKNVFGFTGYFEAQGDLYSELPLAQEAAAKCRIELHTVKITATDFEESFDKVIYALDEPRMGMGAFSQYIVAKEAAKYRKVILAGHGGDEIFGGYPMHKAFLALSLSTLPNKKNELFSFLRQLKLKEMPWIFYALYQLKRYGKYSFAPRIFSHRSLSLDSQRQEGFEMDESSTSYPLEALENYYQKIYLPGLLTVEDKISMAHGLETRVPLCSTELMNWGRSIPIDQRIYKGQLKSLLKEIATPYLPQRIINGPKKGFPTPLRLWFRKELAPYVSNNLLRGDQPIHQVVAPKEILQLISHHQNFKLPFALDEKRAHKIWMLLSVNSWLKQYNLTFGKE